MDFTQQEEASHQSISLSQIAESFKRFKPEVGKST